MDKLKIEDLEAKGFKVGTVAEFLELTPKDEAIIEARLALSNEPNNEAAEVVD